MDAAKALIGAVAGRFLFRHGRVTDVARLGEHFVRVDVAGTELEGAGFVPGDKVQVFLPGLGMRTYTPVTWEGGKTFFVGFLHGEGPGASWLRGVKVSDQVAMMGPRRSIDVGAGAQPLVVVGDETSLAVAAALTRGHGQRQVSALLETSVPDEVRAVSQALGLAPTLVAHGDVEALGTALSAQLAHGAMPVFTGRASTIQALRQRGLKGGKTKAYWAEGKRGLD